MRIVHVVQRFHPAVGGAETHVREVVRELARRGHDVTVATSAHPAAPNDARVDDDGARYRVRRFAARTFRGDYLFPPWLPMRGLADFLIEEKPDLYHAHSYRFATVEATATAAERAGRPFVLTAHGFYPPENAIVRLSRWRYDRARGALAAQAAARCIAVTAHEAEHYEALGVEPARIDVVPNGIPESAFARADGDAFRRAHGLDGRIVLFLARLAHDKGLADLVRAAPAILRAAPDARIVVCGADAGALAHAKRLAARLDVAERVHFLGPVADPRAAYAAADVFVLPSHYEAFGIVLLEAMAQGKPVVATTAGGMPEVVGDAGIVVPPHSSADLALAIASLLGDEPYRTHLGERGRERARKFLWKDVVDKLEETYARAIR